MSSVEVPHSIAIMRMSAIGDAVLTVPLIRTLQQHFPNSQITWITSPVVYSLMEGLDGVEFVVADKPDSLSDYLELRRRFRQLSFDVLLAIQTSLRINLLYPMIHAKRKIGYDKTRGRDAQWLFTNERIPHVTCHTLDSFLAFARQLGAGETVIRWDLPIGAQDYAWAEQHIGAPSEKIIIAINPAASTLERTWRVERYVELANRLLQHKDVHIVLTGGPTEQEKELAQEIGRQLNGGYTDLVGKTNLKQLAAIYSRVKCLIAPDTGPAHIATAMGTPVVGLYAAAAPELWGPYLSREFVINRHPDAIRKFLGKDPQKVSPLTRVHDRGAMDLITVDDVYAMTLKLIG